MSQRGRDYPPSEPRPQTLRSRQVSKAREALRLHGYVSRSLTSSDPCRRPLRLEGETDREPLDRSLDDERGLGFVVQFTAADGSRAECNVDACTGLPIQIHGKSSAKLRNLIQGLLGDLSWATVEEVERELVKLGLTSWSVRFGSGGWSICADDVAARGNTIGQAFAAFIAASQAHHLPPGEVES